MMDVLSIQECRIFKLFEATIRKGLRKNAEN
jgi:hypothetical protein